MSIPTKFRVVTVKDILEKHMRTGTKKKVNQERVHPVRSFFFCSELLQGTTNCLFLLLVLEERSCLDNQGKSIASLRGGVGLLSEVD